MELRSKEALDIEVLRITNDTLQPGQNYNKMYGKEARYNEILVIMITMQKPKRIIYPDITSLCQHVTKDKCETDQRESKSFSSVNIEQLHS